MCGIALILSGFCIDSSSLPNDVCSDAESLAAPVSSAKEKQVLLADDLKAALVRRGPDHLGSKKLYLTLKRSYSVEKENNVPYSNEQSFLPIGSISCRQPSHSSSDEFRYEGPSPDCFEVEFDSKEDKEKGTQCLCYTIENNSYIGSACEVDCAQDICVVSTDAAAELHLIGATLQLRGTIPVHQPLEDSSGNLLVYNGEIFGGINVESDRNDGETLLHLLGSCCYCNCQELGNSCPCIEKGQTSVPILLSKIKGPWALIYWQARSKTVWFGRDAFGRRSLLVHWPTSDDSQFLLSSVSPTSCTSEYGSTATSDNFELHMDSEAAEGALDYWEELPCGIYSLHLDAMKANSLSIVHRVVGQVRKHEWSDLLLKGLIKWERCSLEHKSEDIHLQNPLAAKKQPCSFLATANGKPSKPHSAGEIVTKQKMYKDAIISAENGVIPPETFYNDTVPPPAQKLLIVLRQSVMRRTTVNRIFQANFHKTGEGNHVPVAVLFSGGLDSMILAALLDQCLNSTYEIDLLNVSFDGQLAPDRVTAQAGVRELQRVAPSRRWRLVEIDAELSSLTWETKHVTSLINPARTYMDLNIGIALWLAAGGDGWVDDGICSHHQKDAGRHKYKSEAKILLVGAGADEQCAGYSRHRTKYRLGGWVALEEEMKLDVQRIWKRNLGRDDRCISDNGKEARFPFLDEDVIRTLLEIPLPAIAELDQPVGKGDKKILREVSQLLGLGEAAVLPKRAIQFGSRIARESNRRNFGSNRAANQASAGSVVIKKPTRSYSPPSNLYHP